MREYFSKHIPRTHYSKTQVRLITSMPTGLMKLKKFVFMVLCILTIPIIFHDCDYICVHLLHWQAQHLANRSRLGLADNLLFRALMSLHRSWLCFPVPTLHSPQLPLTPDLGSTILIFDVHVNRYTGIHMLRH